MTNIRTYFSTLGLLFGAPESQVRIIDGSEEGLSGWITANILMEELYMKNNPLETYGVLDMGGMRRKNKLKLFIFSIKIICFYF